ncbi:MAG: energy transducer TonB [Bacteroidota bacterium]
MRTLILLGLALQFHITSLAAQMPLELVHLTIDEAYSPPVYTGGAEALATYINTHLVYPELAVDYSIEGTVVLKINLDRNGQVASAEIVRSLGFGCEQAALEVVNNMPGWKTATRGNRAEESIVLLPIRFRLR